MDALMRSKESDERRFKEAGIPWPARLHNEAIDASQQLGKLYMQARIQATCENEDRISCEYFCVTRLVPTVAGFPPSSMCDAMWPLLTKSLSCLPHGYLTARYFMRNMENAETVRFLSWKCSIVCRSR